MHKMQNGAPESQSSDSARHGLRANRAAPASSVQRGSVSETGYCHVKGAHYSRICIPTTRRQSPCMPVPVRAWYGIVYCLANAPTTSMVAQTARSLASSPLLATEADARRPPASPSRSALFLSSLVVLRRRRPWSVSMLSAPLSPQSYMGHVQPSTPPSTPDICASGAGNLG